MATPFELMPQVMNRRAEEFSEGATRVVRRAAHDFHREVVQLTRVDTGRARSNWVAALDRPFLAVIPPYAPGAKLGLGETANAAAAIAQGVAVISRYDANRNSNIVISNNTPYIGLLNNGDGSRSGDFMVQRALQAASSSLRGAQVFSRREGRR